jgi:hypothetical protein
VLVAACRSAAAFTYNLTTSSTLTEDRTLKDLLDARQLHRHTLANCTDRAVLERCCGARASRV